MLDDIILAAEDEPVDAMMIKRAFSKAGISHKLHLVEDGDAVIDYLTGTNTYADREQYPLPVLLLLDLKLPRRSGLEILEWLRQQPGLRRMPVVVLTSSRQSIDVTRAYDLGANSYLVKPVEFTALIDIMKTLGLYWLVLNEKPQIDEHV
jgi:CheY-like chemotaxis protein